MSSGFCGTPKLCTATTINWVRTAAAFLPKLWMKKFFFLPRQPGVEGQIGCFGNTYQWNKCILFYALYHCNGNGSCSAQRAKNCQVLWCFFSLFCLELQVTSPAMAHPKLLVFHFYDYDFHFCRLCSRSLGT